MSSTGNAQAEIIKAIPHWLVLTLCWMFAILYGVWMLPETVFIRHTCLVIGAFFGTYVICTNKRLLLAKEAAPIWLIAILIAWVTIHLFYIGRDFQGQWEEYTRIWKKIAVESFFAVGLGIALISQSKNKKHTDKYWKIIFFGFTLPGIIYFVKLIISAMGRNYEFTIPVYLSLDPDHIGSRYGISKAWYVFYCLPALALSIGAIANHLESERFALKKIYLYLVCIIATPIIFYIESDRLGAFFSANLVLLGILLVGWRRTDGKFKKILPIILPGLALIFFLSWTSYNRGSEWRMLIADAMVAIEIEKNDAWQYAHKKNNTQLIYPLNKYGERVSPSNYERISWFLVGSELIRDHPFGYGLLSLSFGALAKERWTNSSLSWSHSGWIDYTLGYGIPGFLLIFTALLLAWKNSRTASPPFYLIGVWILPVIFFIFLVKEISSEVFISTLIFIIILAAALSLKKSNIVYEEEF